MSKQLFQKRVILMMSWTVLASAALVLFFVMTFRMYAPLSENNTVAVSGMVTAVNSTKYGVSLDMSNGDSLYLVYPWDSQSLYDSIGYDLDQLAVLLEGQMVECRCMHGVPWVVEIHAENISIDNLRLTEQQITATRIGIGLLGLLIGVCLIVLDVTYWKSIRASYRKAEKKHDRKTKRALKKEEKA